MTHRSRRPAAEAGITIERSRTRVVVRVAQAVIANSTRALVMRATGALPVHYIPREDVDMTQLLPTPLATYCPYKGDAAYWTIRTPERTVENAAWSYEAPYPDVAPIAGHLAFYADRVHLIEEEPGGAAAPDQPRTT